MGYCMYNLIRYVILTVQVKRFLLALLIGGKGTKNTFNPYVGYLQCSLFFDGCLHDSDTDWKV